MGLGLQGRIMAQKVEQMDNDRDRPRTQRKPIIAAYTGECQQDPRVRATMLARTAAYILSHQNDFPPRTLTDNNIDRVLFDFYIEWGKLTSWHCKIKEWKTGPSDWAHSYFLPVAANGRAPFLGQNRQTTHITILTLQALQLVSTIASANVTRRSMDKIQA